MITPPAGPFGCTSVPRTSRGITTGTLAACAFRSLVSPSSVLKTTARLSFWSATSRCSSASSSEISTPSSAPAPRPSSTPRPRAPLIGSRRGRSALACTRTFRLGLRFVRHAGGSFAILRSGQGNTRAATHWGARTTASMCRAGTASPSRSPPPMKGQPGSLVLADGHASRDHNDPVFSLSTLVTESHPHPQSRHRVLR